MCPSKRRVCERMRVPSIICNRKSTIRTPPSLRTARANVSRLGGTAALYWAYHVPRWLGRIGAGAAPESQPSRTLFVPQALLRYRVSLRSMVEPSPPEAFFRSIGVPGIDRPGVSRSSLPQAARRRRGRVPLPLPPSNSQIEWRDDILQLLYVLRGRTTLPWPAPPRPLQSQDRALGPLALALVRHASAGDVLQGGSDVRGFGGPCVAGATEFEAEASSAPPREP